MPVRPSDPPAPASPSPLRWSALEQARAIASGAISAEELLRAYLNRIARLDPDLCSFVQVLEPGALRGARAVDRARRSGEALGPFAGVPIGVKDLNLVRGAFTRFGSSAVPRLWSPFDDRTAAQLRRAGCVIVGKLATAELGALPVTEPDIHPPTRNPWNADRTPGGSSGGSAAAVAAGLLPIAHGTDGAGSIRIPAAFCNLFGLKPSRGRIADPYGRHDPRMLSTCGPIARTVDDAAALLDVLAGVSVPRRHRGQPALPATSFARLTRRPVRGLRVKVLVRSPIAQTDPEVAAATLRVAQLLEELGHHVDEGAASDGTLAEFLPLWQYLIGHVPVLRRGRLTPVTRWLADAGRVLARTDVAARHDELERRIHAWFGDADLWLTPTVAVTAPPIGAYRSVDATAADLFGRAATLGAFTAPFNVGGHPAASIPAGLSAEGLPLGVQLAGRPLADGLVLSVARQLEEALRWSERVPPAMSDA